MKKIQKWLSNYWGVILTAVGGSGAALFLLLFKIKSINGGDSLQEITLHNQLVTKSYSVDYLFHHLVFAPYTIGLIILEHLHLTSVSDIRIIGAFFGLISVLLFFYIIWRWYGSLIAIFASFIFVDNLWFLQNTRAGGMSSLFALALLLMIAGGFLLRKNSHRGINLAITAIIAASSLYIPGMIWLLILSIVWQRKYIADELKRLPVILKISVVLVFIAVVTPLAWSSYQSLGLLKDLSGVGSAPFNPRHYLDRFINLPLQVFIRNNTSNQFSLGHLPYINVFADAMILLGIYGLWVQKKFDRLKLMIAGLILFWILIAFNGSVNAFVLMPIIFLFIAAGMSYLLNEWFRVFPRNPVARSLGITLFTVLIAIVGFYHYDQFFVAWPHTTNALSAYSQHIR